MNSEECYVCKKCDETELGVIIEHVTKTDRGQYKSINHIKNMLKCLQAKEWCDIPDEILNIVKNDSREGCSMSIIKLILKKHRLSSYYRNIPQIYCRIMGVPPIYLSNEMEVRIIYLLQEILRSFKNTAHRKERIFSVIHMFLKNILRF